VTAEVAVVVDPRNDSGSVGGEIHGTVEA